MEPCFLDRGSLPYVIKAKKPRLNKNHGEDNIILRVLASYLHTLLYYVVLVLLVITNLDFFWSIKKPVCLTIKCVPKGFTTLKRIYYPRRERKTYDPLTSFNKKKSEKHHNTNDVSSTTLICWNFWENILEKAVFYFGTPCKLL